MFSNLRILASVALIAILDLQAPADSMNIGDTDVSLTLTGFGPRRAVSAYYDDGSNVFNRTVSGGQLLWSGGLTTFCIQLLERVSIGQTALFDVVEIENVPEAPPQPGPMGIARATLIRDLYARHYDDVMSSSGSEGSDKSAAFAMVIWEIGHQDSDGTTAAAILADLDLVEGNARFRSKDNANLLAGNWLAGLGGGSDEFLGFGGLVGLTQPGLQDYITVVPGPAGMMAFLGLAGIQRPRRRS